MSEKIEECKNLLQIIRDSINSSPQPFNALFNDDHQRLLIELEKNSEKINDWYDGNNFLVTLCTTGTLNLSTFKYILYKYGPHPSPKTSSGKDYAIEMFSKCIIENKKDIEWFKRYEVLESKNFDNEIKEKERIIEIFEKRKNIFLEYRNYYYQYLNVIKEISYDLL